ALNNGQPPQLDQFDKLPEILLFLREEFPEDHLYSKISAVPREVLLPQPWLLGASKESARSAGEYGINFSFAQFIHGHLPKEVLSAYYKHFRPVTEQQEPQVSAAYFTFAADTKEEAEYHAASFEHYIFATEHGLSNKFLSPEEALAFPYSEMDKLVLEQNKQRFVIGSSQEVAEFFHQQEELGLTEAMLITPGYDKQTRFQSFERLAKELL
ncbi:MAG: LLM class flavin-dependent oxidoreductase, partial [Enterococcus faecalis]